MEVTKFQVPTDSNTGRFRVLQTQSVDGWTPVNLRAELNDSGTGTWLIAPDHDEDGIPDCVTDEHKTQLDTAFEKLSLWKIVTDESEVVANVTNQESIQNSPVDLDPYPTYGAWVEWITGQFNPTPIQRNWWGGGNGNSGRLAGVNSAFNASKNGSVKQVFGGTSPYRMHSADFTWQSLPPDVTNFYSIIWGELSPGVTEYKELKPREYDTILTTLLGTASEFNAFLAIVGCQNRYCISGNFSDTASNFGKAWFYKKMAARTPTLTNVTYKRGSQIVNNGDSIVTCVGDAVNLTATAEYSVALSDQTVEFTVPVSLKFVSTPPAEHAYLNQPGQFISLEPGAYHITADLPTGDSTSTQISIISTKVDAITAVKTDIPSEAVPDSDILCKNQNQSLDLTATITPDISDAIADSLITWEVTPSAAGSFTDNTGKTAVWVQAPDFVSSFEDDVVITARCGSNIGTEFKLTIVSAVGSTIHVATSSDSQHLGTSPPDALVSLLPNVEVPKVQKFATDVDAYPLGGPDGWNLNIVSGGAGVTDITDVFDLVTVEHVVDNKLKFTVRTILDAPPGEYHVVDPTGHSEHVFVTKVEIDPVVSNVSLSFSDPINSIINPAGIIIETDPNEDNVAVIEITNVEPSSVILNDDDDRIIWTIESQGGNAEFFVPTSGTSDNTGKKVRAYGISPGRVLFKVHLNGSSTACETYEAEIVAQKDVPFRATMYKTPAGDGTLASTTHANSHINLANIFLRQVGIRLVPDFDSTIMPWTPEIVVTPDSSRPGFYNGDVDNSIVHVLEDVDFSDLKLTLLANLRSDIVSIAYIESSIGPSDRGRTRAHPANVSGESITYNYRITVADPPESHTMILKDEVEMDASHPDVWGFTVFNLNGDPLGDAQRYAETIAHELGHVLNINHRLQDGLTKPITGNLLDNTASGPDLDLIQLKAMHGSEVFE